MMHQARSLKRIIHTLIAMVFVIVAAAACSPKSGSAPAKQDATTHSENDGHNHKAGESHPEGDGHNHQAGTQEAAAMCSEHQVLETACPFCNKSLVEEKGMCGEHGVPEALCTRCKPALEAAFQAEGDWCGEHKLPESQCTICNPDLLSKDAKTAESHGADDGHGHGGDDGHGHGAEEAHVDEVTLTPEAIRKNNIRVEPARKQAMAESYTVPGRVSYNTEAMAHIGTPVEGRVAELKVKLGDTVKKGDVLLVIDSPALGEAQSAYLQKHTEVDVARSALEVSRTSAERAKRLYEGQGISLGELQKREGEYKASQGALRSAESAATAAENNLHLHGMTQVELMRLVKSGEVDPRYAVRAPLGGRVVQREATLGEVVGPDREALMVLADMKILWVLADVPESRVHQVEMNAPATVTVEALGGQSFTGKVSYIAPEMNHETRTAQVRVEIEDGKTPIKPGMFAQVHLGLDQTAGQTQSESLAVPEAAVQSFEGGQAVFVAVADEPGTFAAKQIKTGSTIGKMICVESGLEEGAPVVVDGAFVIKAELAKGIMEGKTCSGH